MAKRVAALLSLVTLLVVGAAVGALRAKDPGVRGGPAGVGSPLPGLTNNEQAFFQAGAAAFTEVEAVPKGLGPRFNFDSCGGCHA